MIRFEDAAGAKACVEGMTEMDGEAVTLRYRYQYRYRCICAFVPHVT
jgi:hypothetical protein